jgi:hypothetical protein
VVVGSLGNDLRVEFKAVGDTVNIASRVEGLAEPGATYVTGDTFNLTTGIFRFESLGDKKVKGKKDLIQLYRVIATSSRRTRFDVNAERGLSPFIGRQRELDKSSCVSFTRRLHLPKSPIKKLSGISIPFLNIMQLEL